MILALAFAVAAASPADTRAAGRIARGALALTRVVVRVAAAAVARNRNFTGDLRRAWQHHRAGEQAIGGDNAVVALRHALRARALARKAALANGWKLKRAYQRDRANESAMAGAFDVGALDRAVEALPAPEEFLLEPRPLKKTP